MITEMIYVYECSGIRININGVADEEEAREVLEDRVLRAQDDLGIEIYLDECHLVSYY